MDAKEISMFRFLDGTDKKFIIPVYQRAYSWKHENCEALLKDLTSVYENNYVSHFFGSIVYVSNDVGGCNEHMKENTSEMQKLKKLQEIIAITMSSR